MTLEDFLKNTGKMPVPQLHKGEANTIEELFTKVIENSLPKKETIIKWHNLLLEYIQRDDAIFFIRRYASAPKKQWNLIRRGFLTEYSSGLKYVFVDNFFAHYFYLMAIKDFVPTIEEFSSLINARKFPYGYSRTSKEKPYQAFPLGKSVNINSSGWKLAHIYSVNQNDYNFNYSKLKKDLFPIGNQSDWKYHSENYPSRHIESVQVDNLKEIVIAHFIRLVHPINYFLVPKTELSNLNIGENPSVISYIRQNNIKRFGKLFTDFENIIMPNILSKEISENNNFEFKFGVKKSKVGNPKTKARITQPNTQKKTSKKQPELHELYSDSDMRIIKSYLIDGLSFRRIEIDIMEIDSPVRGGGFKAKQKLNSYGISADHKATIKINEIDNLITQSEGRLQETLIKLKHYVS